jgi:hypothetical protein
MLPHQIPYNAQAGTLNGLLLRTQPLAGLQAHLWRLLAWAAIRNANVPGLGACDRESGLCFRFYIEG